MNQNNSIIFHIPHSSTEIPKEVRKQFLLSDDELYFELIKMTDFFTNELFRHKKEKTVPIEFPVSRLVVDPERFVDDKLESMSSKGMGVIYTHSSNGKQLRKNLTADERNNLLNTYYYPHHQVLSNAVKEQIDKYNKCLIIDCHSFPSEPLPYENDQTKNRPDICIGTDSFHTPQWLSDKLFELFKNAGYSVEFNRPFSGSLVPEKYYKNNPDVLSVMIETNRKLYLNEKNGERHEGFNILQNNLVSIIDQLNKIDSHHIFMFPFTINFEQNKLKSFQKNENIKKTHNLFFEEITKSLEDAGWKDSIFDESFDKSNFGYNEYFYFYPFVRNAFYYEDRDKQSHIVKYFKRVIKDGVFELHLKGNKYRNPKVYKLELNHVSLRIFRTHIGILLIECTNRSYIDIEDIIKINDYGRRIYPQFLGEDSDQGYDGINITKDSFLPDKIVMSFKGFKSEESFEQQKFKKRHLVVAEYIQKLLGDDFSPSQENYPNQKVRLRQSLFTYQPTIDDRMYVICWYGSNQLSKILFTKHSDSSYCYEQNAMWYRFVFLDGNESTCQHPGMLEKLIKEATYPRWTDYKTLYGISRYSIVCISDGDFPRQHMRRHYAQMAVILLAQRASILKFSNEVAKISQNINLISEKNFSNNSYRDFADIEKQVEMLHAEYIRFVNCLWFTEVTPQEQGIEMYQMAVDIMHLKSDMEDLKREIKELYEFVSLYQERTANRQMNTLTVLGAISLPIMVITGFFGMNLFFITSQPEGCWWWGGSFLFFCGVVCLLYLWMNQYLKNMKATKVLEYIKLSKIFFFINKK